MMDFLNTEHCLAIAGAFIAFIGACATLVNIANSKTDALANRYREVTKEYRAERKLRRRNQLHQQIDLYVKRAEEIYKAQRCLYKTMVCFISSIAVFIVIGLSLSYFKLSDDKFNAAVAILLIVIGLFVLLGTGLMFKSINHFFRESGYAKATFDNETRDCLYDKTRLSLLKLREGYSISRPGLPDCWFQGETEEEALKNIQEVIGAYLESDDELLGEEAQFA